MERVLAEEQAAAETTGRPSLQSVATYRATWRGMEREGDIAQVPIGKFTAGRVDDYLQHLLREGRSARVPRAVLSKGLAYAVRHGLLPSNPVREARRLPGPKSRLTALDDDALDKLRAGLAAWKPASVEGNMLPDILTLHLATGARVGEVLALTWGDVDLAAGTVEIAATLITLPGAGLVRQEHTKTGSSGRRTIQLPLWAMTALERRQETRGVAPAVFPGARGWLWPSTVRKWLRQVRELAGLEAPLSPHLFRRTVATRIAAATDSGTAAAVLGHSSDRVTLQHYIQRARLAPDVRELLAGLDLATAVAQELSSSEPLSSPASSP